MDWESFDLDPADFLDINHVNTRQGRARLTEQIARRALGTDHQHRAVHG